MAQFPGPPPFAIHKFVPILRDCAQVKEVLHPVPIGDPLVHVQPKVTVLPHAGSPLVVVVVEVVVVEVVEEDVLDELLDEVEDDSGHTDSQLPCPMHVPDGAHGLVATHAVLAGQSASVTQVPPGGPVTHTGWVVLPLCSTEQPLISVPTQVQLLPQPLPQAMPPLAQVAPGIVEVVEDVVMVVVVEVVEDVVVVVVVVEVVEDAVSGHTD